MKEIIKEVKSGALPASEIPSFLLWLIGKSFWFWFWLIVVGAIWFLTFSG